MHCIKENNGFRMESYNSRPFQKSFLNQRNKIIAFLLLPSEKAHLFHILKKWSNLVNWWTKNEQTIIW